MRWIGEERGTVQVPVSGGRKRRLVDRRNTVGADAELVIGGRPTPEPDGVERGSRPNQIGAELEAKDGGEGAEVAPVFLDSLSPEGKASKCAAPGKKPP